MKLIDELKKINNWYEMKSFIDSLESKKKKGNIFEALTKYYLLLNPIYKIQLKNVWMHYEVPNDVKTYINFPNTDEGIDLVAKTYDGKYWAIQCKYLGNQESSINGKYISSFLDLSTNVCKNIDLMLTITTANNKSYKFDQKYDNKVLFILGDVWNTLDEDFFLKLHEYLENNRIEYKPFTPKPHQERAIKNAYSHFIEEDNNRGKLIMACGSGKSLTAFWITKELKANKIIIAVPSLALIKQTLDVWTRESLANNLDINWIVVCSDESVAKKDEDIFTSSVKDLGIEVTTNIDGIVEWMKNLRHEISIVFTTYASGDVIAKASKKANFVYDFGIFDEAHKTTGVIDSLYSHLLFDENIDINKRLFMTATEKSYKGNSDEIASMDDSRIYGEDFEVLTFKEALESNILCDYQVVAMMVTKKEIAELVENNNYVRVKEENISKEIESNLIATTIVLHKAILKYGIKHTVSFHSSIQRAKYFKSEEEKLRKLVNNNNNINIQTYHVSGNTPTATRNKDINSFASSEQALITNARCLTEGVDVPNIDSILFSDPRQSTVDIVQAVGRAIRLSKGKQFGYVLVPIIIDDENITLENVKNSTFDSILNIVKALSTHDERIIDLFNTNDSTKVFRGGDLFHIDSSNINLGEKIDLNEFSKNIQATILEKTKILKNRPFEEAREFARSLNLSSGAEWKKYCKGELKDKEPKSLDIPSNPAIAYKLSGWKNMVDWLGRKEYKTFEDAREYIRSLKIGKSYKDWVKYWNINNIPSDIPIQPEQRYYRFGWTNWKDFLLGAENYIKPFEEAREFVKKLGLKTMNDWSDYSTGRLKDILGEIPNDIPKDPNLRYRRDLDPWNWDYWLGISDIKERWLNYEDALELVKNKMNELNLSGQVDFVKFRKSKNYPNNVPTDPLRVYGDKCDMSEWYGTGRKRIIKRESINSNLSFKEAKEIVKNYKEKPNPSQISWVEYHNERFDLMKKDGIVQRPDIKYKEEWIGWADWLGYSKKDAEELSINGKFLSFDEAKKILKPLNLKSEKEYKEWRKTNSIKYLPVNLTQKYCKHNSWKGIPDFLGL